MPAKRNSLTARNELTVKSLLIKYKSANNLTSLSDVPVYDLLPFIQKNAPVLKRLNTSILTSLITNAKLALNEQDISTQDNNTQSNLIQDFQSSVKISTSESSELENDQNDQNSMNKSITDFWKQDTQPDQSSQSPVKSLSNRKRERISSTPTGKSSSSQQSAKKIKNSISSNVTPPSSVKLSDLGGIDSIIAQLLEIVAMPLLHPEVYLHTGIDPPRGVLLHGPPGCGKTMLANALAAEIGVPFLSISAPAVVSGMSGESEKKIRDLFDEARSLAPCLMFIDEIDAITPKRESAQREMERRIVAQLLTSIDSLSLDKTDGKAVVIIGATNRPDSLDPALRRAGRFDNEICISVPSEESREKILKVLSKKLRLEGNFDFTALANMTPGYVGADLNALTAAAGMAAIKRIFNYLKLNNINTSSVFNQVDLSQSNNQKIIDIDMDNENENDNIDNDNDNNDNNDTNFVQDVDKDTSMISNSDSELKTITNTNISVIQKFIETHPDPLTEEQLAPLAITLQDFMSALSTIQPSSKREGFATVPDVTWADVGALSSIRTELAMAIVQPIKRPGLYAAVGISAPAGVLLWGPPGCGKTLLAKAVANESRANFISVRGPELLNKYVGESERAVRQVFVRARASVPCVIFFDELDALAPRRDASLSESAARVVNTLLTELDGLSERNGVYVIAATNRPDRIDSAMLRPGRLDKPLYVELPTEKERFEILNTLTRKTPLDANVDLERIASHEKTRNFSGADLAALVREAAVGALKSAMLSDIAYATNGDIANTDSPFATDDLDLKRKTEADRNVNIKVTTEDFLNAFSHVHPSVSDIERQEYEDLNHLLGWVK